MRSNSLFARSLSCACTLYKISLFSWHHTFYACSSSNIIFNLRMMYGAYWVPYSWKRKANINTERKWEEKAHEQSKRRQHKHIDKDFDGVTNFCRFVASNICTHVNSYSTRHCLSRLGLRNEMEKSISFFIIELNWNAIVQLLINHVCHTHAFTHFSQMNEKLRKLQDISKWRDEFVSIV